MFTLDTNILVYYAAGDEAVVPFVFKHLKEGKIFYLPTIVVAEFFSFPSLTAKDIAMFEYLFPRLDVISLDLHVAKAAGELRRTYHIKLGDSVVAATALTTESTLLTRNLRDFKKISDLEVLSL